MKESVPSSITSSPTRTATIGPVLASTVTTPAPPTSPLLLFDVPEPPPPQAANNSMSTLVKK